MLLNRIALVPSYRNLTSSSNSHLYFYQINISELDQHASEIITDFDEAPVSIAEARHRIKATCELERSPTQLGAFMTRHGFKYRKLGHIPAKADPKKITTIYRAKAWTPLPGSSKRGTIPLFYGCSSLYFRHFHLFSHSFIFSFPNISYLCLHYDRLSQPPRNRTHHPLGLQRRHRRGRPYKPLHHSRWKTKTRQMPH